ncbi:MAG: ABC transporter permease [Candidatus Bathyarchaeota archaeon]|nr:ABC transporter permease [Candidatus Bathyarchaeota archaeon]
MKPQRVLALTKKEMKKTFREPAVLFMIFLFPVVFVFAFGASFGGVGVEQTAYNLGVVNMDQPTSIHASQILIAALSDTKILKVHVYVDNQTAQNDLLQGKLQGVMIIPSDFSQSFASYQAASSNPGMWKNATVALYLDQGSLVATQALPPIIQQILTAITGQSQQAPSTPFRLEIASLVTVEAPSAFAFMAPGMFTFASIFLIMMVAQSFTQDRENGMMKRIRITPTTPTEFMTSQIISYMLIALVQAALVFIMLYLMGFRPNVGMSIYAFAFALVLIFSLSNIGFGLITATIAKSSGAATGLSFLFVLPQLFLGTFVGASLSSAAQVAGKFVPSYYVTDALTSLFLRGAPITSPTVLLDFAAVSASCITILLIGILLYGKYFKI